MNLSGGEQQKLLLARALYHDAPVLVLDEPTAALDPIAENELYQKYNALTSNKTSFFISHRLSSTRFCDRILFIADGRIAEMGTHEELMAMHGAYWRMFQIQSHYYKEEHTAQAEREEGHSLKSKLSNLEFCAFAAKTAAAILLCKTAQNSRKGIMINMKAMTTLQKNRERLPGNPSA